MSIIKTVFISHSWSYSNHYETLHEWIFDTKWNLNGTPIHLYNSSVPKDDPIHNAPNEETLKNAIYQRIATSDIVVIPTGMYTNYSKWINKEISGAQQYSIPILAANPRGQERKASVVLDAANAETGWTKQSVMDNLWQLVK